MTQATNGRALARKRALALMVLLTWALAGCLTAEHVRKASGNADNTSATDTTSELADLPTGDDGAGQPDEGQEIEDVTSDGAELDTAEPPRDLAEAQDQAELDQGDGQEETLQEVETPETAEDTTEPAPETTDSIDAKEINEINDLESPLGAYGELCGAAPECESNLCVGNNLSGQKMCTQTCAGLLDNGGCPGSDICGGPVTDPTNPDGGEIYVCVENDSGLSNCEGSACIQLKLNNNVNDCVCASYCHDADMCPGGFVCSPYEADGGTVKACTPVGAGCDPNGIFSDCFGLCLNLGNGDGLCSGACETHADCLTGWSCFKEEDFFGGVTTYCAPD